MAAFPPPPPPFGLAAAAPSAVPATFAPAGGGLRTKEHFLHAFLVAAVLSPCSYAFGRAARRLKLPQITGYLVSGVVCGPYGLSILSVDGVSSLSILEGACLGVIGLAAGSELHLAELARSKRAVVSITVGICLATWALVFTALVAAAPVAAPPSMIVAAAARLGRAAAGVAAAASPVAAPPAAAAAAAAGGAAAVAGSAVAAAAGSGAAAAAEAAAAAAGAAATGAAAATPAAAAAAAGAAAATAVASAALSSAEAAQVEEAVSARLGMAVASLGATLMMARSPASAVRGPQAVKGQDCTSRDRQRGMGSSRVPPEWCRQRQRQPCGATRQRSKSYLPGCMHACCMAHAPQQPANPALLNSL
jgi:hypothetical protein